MAGGSPTDWMCGQQVWTHLSFVLWECHAPILITAALCSGATAQADFSRLLS